MAGPLSPGPLLVAIQEVAQGADAGAEALMERPEVLLGIGAVALVFGLFLLPLRMAVTRRCLAPAEAGEPGQGPFAWSDLFIAAAAFVVAQTVATWGAMRSINGSIPDTEEERLALLEKFTFLDTATIQSVSLMAVAAVLFLLASQRPGGISALGLGEGTRQRFPMARYFVGVTTYILSVPLLYGAGALATGVYALLDRAVPEQDVAVAIQEQLQSQPVFILFFAVLLIPLLEEFLFRGFLLELITRTAGRVWGVVLSSVAFGALHGLAAAPMVTVLAVILAVTKLRTRSLLVVWVMHGVHNGLVVLLQSQGTV